jgi:hypothetical protein
MQCRHWSSADQTAQWLQQQSNVDGCEGGWLQLPGQSLTAHSGPCDQRFLACPTGATTNNGAIYKQKRAVAQRWLQYLARSLSSDTYSCIFKTFWTCRVKTLLRTVWCKGAVCACTNRELLYHCVSILCRGCVHSV